MRRTKSSSAQQKISAGNVHVAAVSRASALGPGKAEPKMAQRGSKARACLNIIAQVDGRSKDNAVPPH